MLARGPRSTACATKVSNFWDVAAAGAYGFWTCWVNRGGAPEEVLGVRPDVTVKGLDEIQV